MSRWKGKKAAQVASDNPLSGLYDAIRECGPLDCLITDSAGIVSANAAQFKLLNSVGFGSSLVVDVQSRKLKFPGSEEEAEDVGEVHFLQLTLEEAFFLAFELNCVRFYRKNSEGRLELAIEEVWCLMQNLKPNFPRFYKAYSYLRAKRWVVRPGPQYGADFMAYRHHPSLVHSDYAVLVMDDEQQAGMKTWSSVRGMSRLCGSVAKVLLLLYVTPVQQGAPCPSSCLGEMSVTGVEVKRWLPEKHREDK